MTAKRRNEIMAQEVLVVKDVQELYSTSPNEARKLIREWREGIKEKNGRLRLNIEGKISIYDYLDYMNTTQRILLEQEQE